MRPEVSIFDIEGDGLVPNRIHCLCVNDNGKEKNTTNYENMKKFFTKAEVIVGHNIVLFDIPVVERILGIEVKAKVVDTLALSWYLFPKRVRHGLEWWGEDYGVPKPVIDDWDDLPIEDYIHRCTEDVKINTKLWNDCWDYLMLIYDGDEEAIWRLIDYLTFKMKCVALQEKSKWKVDVPFVEEKLAILEHEQGQAFDRLAKVMPNVKKYKKKTRPLKPFKKDGTYSAVGERWFDELEKQGLPKEFNGELKVFDKEEPPNPSSVPQIKEWLFTLGWEPETYKIVRNKETNEVRQIPQVKRDGGELCDSVLRLAEKEPDLKALEGLSIITHRIGLLKGFLRDQENGYLKARVGGFTNTLRLKHSEIVNLPGVDKPYGDWIRGALIAPEGHELCGSDMAALEDRTKQHYMWEYDPEYVKKMQEPGYCPHIDIAELAGYLKPEEGQRYRDGAFLSKDDEKRISAERKRAKPVNYGGVYGQTPEGLAQTTGMDIKDARRLHKIYWERNWSVKKIAEDCKVKQIGDQKWLFNPVSKLWYSLRHEKDRFSTLNQGTGAYCFDMWVQNVLEQRKQLTAQFHDEVVLTVKKGFREKATRLLKDAIKAVNEQLKLNRDLDIDVQFGDKYADIH